MDLEKLASVSIGYSIKNEETTEFCKKEFKTKYNTVQQIEWIDKLQQEKKEFLNEWYL
jgi:hypothetical protein